jgi:hypothetical protein
MSGEGSCRLAVLDNRLPSPFSVFRLPLRGLDNPFENVEGPAPEILSLLEDATENAGWLPSGILPLRPVPTFPRRWFGGEGLKVNRFLFLSRGTQSYPSLAQGVHISPSTSSMSQRTFFL